MEEVTSNLSELHEQLASPPAQDDLGREDAPALRMTHVDDFVAPFTLSALQEDEYHRRFATLLVDTSRTRVGGTARVMCAMNAFGERIAIKVPTPAEDMDAHARADHEFQAHRVLSGVRGYPRLYGRGMLDGQPCLIQEWIEGEPLLGARLRMAVDDAGRISPLTAARIGRDLFDILARMDALSEPMAHGDISLRNVMVHTDQQPVEEQVQEGAFDLCVVDLGSSIFAMPSGDASGNARQRGGATPQFAAPELLATDGMGPAPQAAPALDVYAAARVVRMLLDEDTGLGAHAAASDIAAVLMREPEVAVMVSRVASGVSPYPDADEIKEALAQVDAMLFDVLDECLQVAPNKRPQAASARDALAAFCDQYADNLERALRGEAMESPLISSRRTGARWLTAHDRARIRSIGKGVTFSLWASCAVAAGVLLNGASATPVVGSIPEGGGVSGALVTIALLVLPLIGFLLRGRHVASGTGLARGTAGVLLGGVLLCALVLAAGFQTQASEHLAAMAALACCATSWCSMVLDYAFPAPSVKVQKRLGSGTGAKYALPKADERKTDHV